MQVSNQTRVQARAHKQRARPCKYTHLHTHMVARSCVHIYTITSVNIYGLNNSNITRNYIYACTACRQSCEHMCVRKFTHTRVHLNNHTRARIHTHTYTHNHTHTYRHTHTNRQYICTIAFMHTHMRAGKLVNMFRLTIQTFGAPVSSTRIHRSSHNSLYCLVSLNNVSKMATCTSATVCPVWRKKRKFT
jgi:hypothetical protein